MRQYEVTEKERDTFAPWALAAIGRYLWNDPRLVHTSSGMGLWARPSAGDEFGDVWDIFGASSEALDAGVIDGYLIAIVVLDEVEFEVKSVRRWRA